jgi:hypothetical protein
MIRATVAALVGLLAGATLAAALVWLAMHWLRGQTAPKSYEVEHWVVYVTLVVGAGLGAVSGAVIGLAGAVSAALRRRESSATPPTPPGPSRPA